MRCLPALEQVLMNLTAITVPTVLLLTFVFKVHVTPGPGLVDFSLLAFILAFLISFNFDYLVGLMAFYNESIWGLTITKEVILTVLSGALNPLQFFPDAIQKILLVLPFQAIYYTPLMMVTKPDQNMDCVPANACSAIFLGDRHVYHDPAGLRSGS